MWIFLLSAAEAVQIVILVSAGLNIITKSSEEGNVTL